MIILITSPDVVVAYIANIRGHITLNLHSYGNSSEPEIPYLEKGKWKATPEDEAEAKNNEWDSVQQA